MLADVWFNTGFKKICLMLNYYWYRSSWQVSDVAIVYLIQQHRTKVITYIMYVYHVIMEPFIFVSER